MQVIVPETSRSFTSRRSPARSDWAEGAQLLHDLEQQELQVSESMYTSAIRSAKRWRMALGLLCHLQRPALQANTMTYGAAAYALRNETKWIQSLSLLTGAQGASLESSLVTYNITTTSLGRSTGQWMRVGALLSDLKRVYLKPDIVSYNSMISSEGVGWQKAIALKAQMRAQQEGNMITLNSMGNSFSRAAVWEQAMRVRKDVAALHSQPDLVMVNTVINACKPQWSTALFLRDPSWSQQSPDAFTYVACISCCESGAQWQRAFSLLGRSEAQQLSSSITYNAFAAVLNTSEQWLQNLALLCNQRWRRLPADIITFGTLVTACEGCAQWPAALMVFQELLSSGPMPDLIAYNAATSACGRGSQWQFALTLFFELFAARLQGNSISRNSAISACANGGHWEHALLLLSESWATIEAWSALPRTVSGYLLVLKGME